MSKELELLREAVKILEEKENQQGVCCKNPNGDKVQLSELNPSEVFKVGGYDFMVLEQGDGQTFVCSKGFVAEDVIFDENTRNYAESSIKKFIESDVQPVIERELGSDVLVEHTVDLVSVDMQKEFEPCTCKVRLATFDEARKFNNLLADKSLPDWWWTCTPWSTAEREWPYGIAVVCPSGYIYFDNCLISFGVRPFCILKSNIFVSKGE